MLFLLHVEGHLPHLVESVALALLILLFLHGEIGTLASQASNELLATRLELVREAWDLHRLK